MMVAGYEKVKYRVKGIFTTAPLETDMIGKFKQ